MMAIIRTNKVEDQYARISRFLLQDDSLTWEARGLAAYLLSKPPDWRIEVDDLIHSSPAGRKVVYRIIDELIHAGYIVREQIRRHGRFECDYYLYETKELAETHVAPVVPIKPVPPVPLTETGDGHPSRASVTETGDGHRLYKEEQTKVETKDTQTKELQTTDNNGAGAPEDVVVCGQEKIKSRHSFETLLKWAKWKKAKDGSIVSVDALARARWKDGKSDVEVDSWLSPRGSPAKPPKQGGKKSADNGTELYRKFLDELYARLNENTFARWFEAIEEVSRSGTTLYLRHPDPLAEEMILTNYFDVVEEVLSALDLGDCRVEFLSS